MHNERGAINNLPINGYALSCICKTIKISLNKRYASASARTDDIVSRDGYSSVKRLLKTRRSQFSSDGTSSCLEHRSAFKIKGCIIHSATIILSLYARRRYLINPISRLRPSSINVVLYRADGNALHVLISEYLAFASLQFFIRAFITAIRQVHWEYRR